MFDKYAIISEEMGGKISRTLTESLRLIPDFCIFADDGQCEGPFVDGHIVQEARQKLFAKNGKVMTFDQPPFAIAIELMERGKWHLPRLVNTGVATTERFTCRKHDMEVFADIEQREVNINTLDGNLQYLLTLMAYKGVCGFYAKKRKDYLAWKRTSVIHPNEPVVDAVVFQAYHNLKKAWDMLCLVEIAMDPRTDINMLHEVTETGAKPIVAANSCYMVINPTIVGTTEPLTGTWTTKVVTAYPTQERQMVITSFLQRPAIARPVQVKRLGDNRPSERHFAATVASATLIQECESITMSPEAWYAIPEHKRQAISNYYMACTPGVPWEIQLMSRPDPEWLNLFGTSPLGQ